MRNWSGRALLALLIAVAAPLGWALAAAQAGGAAYGSALLVDQTLSRLAGAHADHAHPVPWYLWILPLALFPWTFWRPCWQALAAVARAPDRGARFAVSWVVPAFLVLSAAHGKAVHYLVPLLPGVCLLLSRGLVDIRWPGQPSARPVAVATLSLGLLIVALGRFDLLQPFEPPPALAGLILALVGVALWRIRWSSPRHVLRALSINNAVMLCVGFGGFMAANASRYDLVQPARALAQIESHGAAIAHVGHYHDQFHFLGRLRRPFEVLNRDEAAAWASANPDGWLIEYRDEAPPAAACRLAMPARGRWLVIEPAWQRAARPAEDCADVLQQFGDAQMPHAISLDRA